MKDFSELTKESIFRDSKVWYADTEQALFSTDIINLCKKHAGKKILDFGCATGSYCVELKKLGFECAGVDINEEYVRISAKRGIDAYLIKDKAPFEDRSFDTVLLIEVLEHLKEPGTVLKEAQRLARKNILISTPSCEGLDTLRNCGLIYEHFLELDHINFFTETSLRELLSKYYNNLKIIKRAPIYPFRLLPLPFFYYIIGMLYKSGILKPTLYAGLFAIVNLEIGNNI